MTRSSRFTNRERKATRNQLPPPRRTGPPPKPPRRDRGTHLQQRDRDVMRFIGEQKAVRYDQLRVLLAAHPTAAVEGRVYLSDTRTREQIERWEADGYAIYNTKLDRPGWIYLTKRGLYHAGLPARYEEPKAESLPHLFWINETRFYLAKRFGHSSKFEWQSERMIEITRKAYLEEQKVARAHGDDIVIPSRYTTWHTPDAILSFEDEEERTWVIAIEVELSGKGARRWQDIFEAMYRSYDQILYYVSTTPSSLYNALVQAVQKFETRWGSSAQGRRQDFIVLDHLYRGLTPLSE
jgi:hypothetical protein